MSAFVDPAEAVNALAAAASKVVQAWPYHDVPSAIRHLSYALDQYDKARPPPFAAEKSTACQTLGDAEVCNPVVGHEPEAGYRPQRFKIAVEMIDPAALDLAGLARGIISACAEVSREHGLPAKDPAVLLIVRQLAWVCDVTSDSEPFAELIAECWRQSKRALPER